MGSGVLFSMFYGAGKTHELKSSICTSLWFIGLITLLINTFSLIFIDEILGFMKVPFEILDNTKEYVQIIFYGIGFTFFYNHFTAVLRSVGNSVTPLIFLIIAAIINIVLDIVFIVPLDMGVAGAAWATIIAQGFSAVSRAVYSTIKIPDISPERKHLTFDSDIVRQIANYSILTSLQQSIMNFGILMVQGLVNSFGVSVMAAFAAGVNRQFCLYASARFWKCFFHFYSSKQRSQ